MCVTTGIHHLDVASFPDRHVTGWCRKAEFSRSILKSAWDMTNGASMMADSSMSDEPDSSSVEDLTVLEQGSESDISGEVRLANDGLTVEMTDSPEFSADQTCDDGFVSERLLNRYIVREVIGRGGVGVIHRGWDTLLNREVAVKVLRKKFVTKPEIHARFINEARLTSRLMLPGIIPIHEFGISSDNRPDFLMRLMTGETLDTILNRRTRPDEDFSSLLSIFLQICQTIAYAHSQGVIHRDIKPSNIMVGKFGVLKVMDWGMAKSLRESRGTTQNSAEKGNTPLKSECDGTIPSGFDGEADITSQGTVFGTPAYLPPEQARGENEKIDERADVFGLGGILCCILTGSPPYTGQSGSEIFRKAASADLTAAMDRLDRCFVPADVLNLAKRCLAPAIEERPANAGEVVAILTDHFQADQRRAERDLVRFFELTLDMFCIAGMDGYFRRVNANFVRLLGYSAEELTTRPFFDFVHPDDLKATYEVLSRISRGELCIQFTNRYRHRGGHYLWLEWNARLVEEENAVYAVARDVTERVDGTKARHTSVNLNP